MSEETTQTPPEPQQFMPADVPNQATPETEQEQEWKNPFALSFEDEDNVEPTTSSAAEESARQPVQLELPDGMEVDPDAVSCYANAATECGLDSKQATAFALAHSRAIEAANHARFEADGEKLKQEWGVKFDDNRMAANAMAKRLLTAGMDREELASFESPLGMKLLYHLSVLAGEGITPGTNPQPVLPQKTAQEELNSICGNLNNPVWRAFCDPKATLQDKVAAQQTMRSLFERDAQERGTIPIPL